VPSTTIEYRLLAGTRAAVGRSGNHTIVADRPEGKAGGMGLGFNGGELLALAIGGCFCNDLQVVADEMGLTITDLEISVTLQFGGTPSRTTGATMDVNCTLADGADPTELIERARRLTNIGNSVRTGFPVQINGEALGRP
jgi:organic hydroperoxide reductase OsmC/OhrA